MPLCLLYDSCVAVCLVYVPLYKKLCFVFIEQLRKHRMGEGMMGT